MRCHASYAAAAVAAVGLLVVSVAVGCWFAGATVAGGHGSDPTHNGADVPAVVWQPGLGTTLRYEPAHGYRTGVANSEAEGTPGLVVPRHHTRHGGPMTDRHTTRRTKPMSTADQLRRASRQVREAVPQRDRLVKKMRSEGASLGHIAELAGISHQSIANIIKRPSTG